MRTPTRTSAIPPLRHLRSAWKRRDLCLLQQLRRQCFSSGAVQFLCELLGHHHDGRMGEYNGYNRYDAAKNPDGEQKRYLPLLQLHEHLRRHVFVCPPGLRDHGLRKGANP